MRESILLINTGEGDLLRNLRMALLPLKIHLNAIDPSDHEKKLGALAGMSQEDMEASAKLGPAAPSASPTEITEPMLVFVNLAGNRLDRVLAALRGLGLPLPNKAVLTPTNCQWTPVELFAELQQERAAIAAANANRAPLRT